ncbi:hypothetical protein T484DRAFT_1856139 [Baffinella frigidus]|nr:hypothetical protein T484DRAFT_1856139 [Cryptophyta sp. CCMP2293]
MWTWPNASLPRRSGSLRLITVEGADYADAGGEEVESAVMVGGGNFGTSACSREDFMLMQVRMTDTIDRAEARLERSPRSDNSAFEAMCAEFEEQVDALCNQFEDLKALLVDHNTGRDGSARVVSDSLRLKTSICRMLSELDARESDSAVPSPTREVPMWGGADSPSQARSPGNQGPRGRRGSLSLCLLSDECVLPGVASNTPVNSASIR